MGSVVNPLVTAPRSPGSWVDEDRCDCGAAYADHRGSYGFHEAAQRLRAMAKAAGDEGGGFRSRGAVLWVLRTLKLESWYLEHWPCGQWAESCP